MSSSSDINVEELLNDAQDWGFIGEQSLVSLSVNDIGNDIAAGMNVSMDNVGTSEVTLVSMLIDDSGSIYSGGNVQNVINGHNLVLETLRGSNQKDGILVHTRYINGTILYPYISVDEAIEMNSSNYDANGGTPLYDQYNILLGTVIAQTQQFLDSGIQCRSINVVITDGEDVHSTNIQRASDLTIIRDMIQTENHIVAGIGFANSYVDFEDIFRKMGIPEQWILGASDDKQSLMDKFRLFAESASTVSQSSQVFNNSLTGGFEL